MREQPSSNLGCCRARRSDSLRNNAHSVQGRETTPTPPRIFGRTTVSRTLFRQPCARSGQGRLEESARPISFSPSRSLQHSCRNPSAFDAFHVEHPTLRQLSRQVGKAVHRVRATLAPRTSLLLLHQEPLVDTAAAAPPRVIAVRVRGTVELDAARVDLERARVEAHLPRSPGQGRDANRRGSGRQPTTGHTQE